ncbi:hypothetical protein ACTID9_01005 [Brevibacillus fluminis]|uniref:hypothetical protein n=1 Tax=Brevibacillus fluminis TaxID=511487 RepID=UPI003F8BF597
MEKVLVTPTADNRLYIHPETKQEFPSGQNVEAARDWFIDTKIRMGHLKEVEPEEKKPSRKQRAAEEEAGEQ